MLRTLACPSYILTIAKDLLEQFPSINPVNRCVPSYGIQFPQDVPLLECFSINHIPRGEGGGRGGIPVMSLQVGDGSPWRPQPRAGRSRCPNPSRCVYASSNQPMRAQGCSVTRPNRSSSRAACLLATMQDDDSGLCNASEKKKNVQLAQSKWPVNLSTSDGSSGPLMTECRWPAGWRHCSGSDCWAAPPLQRCWSCQLAALHTLWSLAPASQRPTKEEVVGFSDRCVVTKIDVENWGFLLVWRLDL